MKRPQYRKWLEDDKICYAKFYPGGMMLFLGYHRKRIRVDDMVIMATYWKPIRHVEDRYNLKTITKAQFEKQVTFVTKKIAWLSKQSNI